MTAHLVGQILLAVMFGVSATMLIADLCGNWHRIRAAFRGQSTVAARPRRVPTTLRKDHPNGR